MFKINNLKKISDLNQLVYYISFILFNQHQNERLKHSNIILNNISSSVDFPNN